MKSARLAWVFGLKWLLATTAGWTLAYIMKEYLIIYTPVLLEMYIWPAGIQRLSLYREIQLHSLEVIGAIATIVSTAVIVTVRCLVQRRRITRADWWLLVQSLGWALVLPFVLVFVASEYTPMDCALAMSSVMQWFVLRRTIPRAVWWIIASLIGAGMVFTALGPILADNKFPGGVPGYLAVEGAVVGLMQMLFLQRVIYRAGWWILASIGGRVLGSSFLLLRTGESIANAVVKALENAYIGLALVPTWEGACGGAIAGVITGSVLVVLMRFQKSLPDFEEKAFRG